MDLAEAGIYDFWYGDLDLASSFKASLDMDPGVYADTLTGCGTLDFSGCCTSYTLLSPTVNAKKTAWMAGLLLVANVLFIHQTAQPATPG